MTPAIFRALSKFLKPYNNGATEYATDFASTTKITGNSNNFATSAVLPSDFLAPSNKPITPSTQIAPLSAEYLAYVFKISSEVVINKSKFNPFFPQATL